MSAKTKVLWVVNYDKLDDFVRQAVAVKATAVAIRSDNNLVAAITKFHAEKIDVYGWRWPSSQGDACMKEASKIADLIKNDGLDGYFVDPEGAPGKPYDWDRAGLSGLATDFVGTIKAADENKRFGVTSHYLAKFCFPNIPWAAFFQHADVYLPQSYWRSTEGIIGHGDPADNYAVGIDRWTKSGAAADKIVPMGGELGSTTVKDLNAHVAAAAAHGRDELHFYVSEPSVTQPIWNAIAAA